MIAWLTFGVSQGSTFAEIPALQSLSTTSAAVITGVVTVTRTEPCSLGLCTAYTVTVSETWRGPTRQTVVITLPGGRYGDLTQRVAGLPLWSRGDEVVVFLDDEGQANWTSLFTILDERDSHAIVGGPSEQGPTRRDRPTAIATRELTDPLGRRHLTSVQELRDQVIQAESTRP